MTCVSSFYLQAKRGILAWDLQTAPRVCAVPDTSGLVSVSQCWRRARCARAIAGKAHTVWSCSSAATVVTAWPADQRKESKTTVSAGLQPGTYTPVRDADTNAWTHTATEIYTHVHTHPANRQISHRHWQPLFSLAYTWDADTQTLTHRDTQYLRHSFLPKLLTQTAPGRIDMIPGKVIHPEGCNSARRTDPIPHQQTRSRKFGSDISEVLGRSIHVVGNGRAVLFLFLWNFKPQLLQ